MLKKILFIAGVFGMLFYIPQSTIRAEYRGDRFEERGPDRYDRRPDRDRYDRRDRYDNRRWERERNELRRLRFTEERRRLRPEERRRLRYLERHLYERGQYRDRKY